jgi:flagellar basal body-associated protein FliL
MRCIACLLLVTVAFAADQAVVNPPPTPAPAPDPTAAVVAEGRFVYRQRDLDALLLIAKRHAKNKLSDNEQEVVRLALVRLLTTREAFADALSALPPSYPVKARDALVLDLLDYQAEPASRPAAPEVKDTPAAAVKDPVLVRLPPLTLHRAVKGQKRQLTLGLALHFRDPDLAKKLEPRAPLVQDAILAFAQKLSDAQITDPDQGFIKDGLIKAVQAKLPEFPADGILIPQLDTGDTATGDAGK